MRADLPIMRKTRGRSMSRPFGQPQRPQAKKVPLPSVPQPATPQPSHNNASWPNGVVGGRLPASSSAQLQTKGTIGAGVKSSPSLANTSLVGQRTAVTDDQQHQRQQMLRQNKGRGSTGSNSSQASSGFESMQSDGVSQVPIATTRGDSPLSRSSVHSSSSGGSGGSLGSSLERLNESSSYAFGQSQINVAQLLLNGVPDDKVLFVWLQRLGYDEYAPLLLSQGYDVATLARMTPEDLTAVGITKPGHRKRLTAEIHRIAIDDNLPSIAPNLREWLYDLDLAEYIELFECQGYNRMTDVLQLSWEDFEDVGIKKLGHMKKLQLAIKKLKETRRGSSTGPSRAVGQVKPYYHGEYQQPSTSQYHMQSIDQQYGTFPRRTSPGLPSATVSQVVAEGAFPHDRPTMTVKPRPNVTKIPSFADDIELYSVAKCAELQNSPCHNTAGIVEPAFTSRVHRGIKLQLHSPSKILSSPPPPPPPLSCRTEHHHSEKPSTADEFVQAERRAMTASVSLSDSLDEEFPPPPWPIQCEQSLLRLRSVIDGKELNVQSNTKAVAAESGLPFANENCGTIRVAKNPPTQQQSELSAPRQSVTSARANSSGGGGDVLNDIGSMLQNLTHELDALLVHPDPSTC